MTSLWKPKLWASEHCFPSLRTSSLSFQVHQTFFLYNGRFFIPTRSRPAFFNFPFSYFTSSRVKGRPIQNKFRQVNQRKKRK